MINYKDGNTMFKIMKIVKELRLRYYVDAHCVVQTYWQGTWYPWHEIMLKDKRLEVN